MIASFDEFCAHYELDPTSDDSRQEYEAYRLNLALFSQAAQDLDRLAADMQRIVSTYRL